MSYVSYYSGPSDPSGPSRWRRGRKIVRRLAARLRGIGSWNLNVREREPRAEVAAWVGRTAAGEFVQALLRPLAGASLVAGVGLAAVIGVAVGALVDLTLTTTPAVAGMTTGFVIGVVLAFGGAGPLPAVAGGLFGWLIGGIVESGMTELVKQPATHLAGVIVGWCMAAFAGWLVGRVATLLPWPWAIGVAAVIVALGVRWTVACVHDQRCAVALTSTGIATAKWATIAVVWLFAVLVLSWLWKLRRAPASSSAAHLVLHRLWPFGLVYAFWWAPGLTVLALRLFTPGYQPTSVDIRSVAFLVALTALIAPASFVTGRLLPAGTRRTDLSVTTAEPRQVVVRNGGTRTAKRIGCTVFLHGAGETLVLVHREPPTELAPGASFRLTLGMVADNVPYGAELRLILTWRERLRIRQLRRTLHFPRRGPL